MNQLNSIKSIQKPEIKKYTQIRKFLREFYEYRKSTDSLFNHDIWSAELGFKSRSFMYLICSGKRSLTQQVVNKLSIYFKFNESEKNHLMLLALYDRAKTAELKYLYLDKILESVNPNEEILKGKKYSEFLASKTMPLIKLLLAYEDSSGTEEELLTYLKISKSDLSKELQKLHEMNLIHRVQLESKNQIIWKVKSKSFSIPEEQSNQVMGLFHLNSLNEATEKLQNNDIFKRFRSILFTIKEDQQEMLLSEIEIFLNKVKNKLGNTKIKNRKMIKLNLQAYQVI